MTSERGGAYRDVLVTAGGDAVGGAGVAATGGAVVEAVTPTTGGFAVAAVVAGAVGGPVGTGTKEASVVRDTRPDVASVVEECPAPDAEPEHPASVSPANTAATTHKRCHRRARVAMTELTLQTVQARPTTAGRR